MRAIISVVFKNVFLFFILIIYILLNLYLCADLYFNEPLGKGYLLILDGSTNSCITSGKGGSIFFGPGITKIDHDYRFIIAEEDPHEPVFEEGRPLQKQKRSLMRSNTD
jgi:hypothetical protein